MEAHEPTRAELYGVPITCRISGSLNTQLAREAKSLGISLAKHTANLLVSGHANVADQIAETSILLKEKQQLSEEVAALKAKLAARGEAQRLVVAKLERNYHVLQSFLQKGRGVVSKQELVNAGFDMQYVTSVITHNNKFYFCVFDACYLQEKEKVYIDTIQLT